MKAKTMTKLDTTIPRHKELLAYAQKEIAHYHTNNCGRNLTALQQACTNIVTRCLSDRSEIIKDLMKTKSEIVGAITRGEKLLVGGKWYRFEECDGD